MEYKFVIENDGEVGAGINPFFEEVSIKFKNEDKYDKETEEELRNLLEEFFDGSGVSTKKEYDEFIKKENEFINKYATKE